MKSNPSGISPIEYKVLVEPIEVDEKSKGGIILPDEHKDRQQFAQMQGTLVAASPLAFTYEGAVDWAKPKPGDRVLYAKFAGAVVDGKDGKKYRLINDKDVSAVLS
jgi:chaperonin GroES